MTMTHTRDGAPCARCGHNEIHSDLAGCLHDDGRGGYCDCPSFVAAEDAAQDERTMPETTEVGRMIPSRRTDPGTSHKAEKAVTVKAGTQRHRLLVAFSALDDATDEEAMEHAVGVAPTSEFAKRCSELRDGGYIEPTGEERKGAAGVDRIVSRITDKGREALR